MPDRLETSGGTIPIQQKRETIRVQQVQERVLQKEKQQQKVQERLEHSFELKIHNALEFDSTEFSKSVKKIISNAEKQILQFEGGSTKHFLNQWKKLTSDPEILKIVTGIELEFCTEPVQNNVLHQYSFNEKENIAIDAEIQKLLNKRIIVESRHENEQFIFPIFIRTKKDGNYRLICNLKYLNQYIQYHHFKMDSLFSVLRMITPGCCMAFIDLKDANYCLPVSENYQKY